MPRPHRAPSRRTVALACGFLALLSAGCITRPVRVDVVKTGGIEVFLRSERRLGTTLEKGYEHPVTISSVRLAHILSRIDIRTDVKAGNQRRPAIPTDVLYPIADALEKALKRATPEQEVVVMSIERKKHLAIFDRKFLTSFVAYARGDELFIHLARTEWKIPTRREDRPPEPVIGNHQQKFRVYPGDAMTPIDRQTVAVQWRDPVFRRPTRTSISATGQVVRKTILMESSEDVGEDAAPAERRPFPDDLSAQQLRELADLEDERATGQITEGEYRARRNRILESAR